MNITDAAEILGWFEIRHDDRLGCIDLHCIMCCREIESLTLPMLAGATLGRLNNIALQHWREDHV